MSVTEYYNPAHRGHQRMNTFNKSATLLTVESSHQLSSTMDSHPLSRSKSDMDVSALPRTQSISQSSNTMSAPRSETFPRAKEEKQGGMKSLLSKSSKLLQKRRTLNRLRSMDWQQYNDSRPQSRSGKNQVTDLDSGLRPMISEPYNFRHLTHGGPAQAKALQSAEEERLVTEFSVIRASQAPKPELKGIKADDIVPQHNDIYSLPVSRSPSPPSGEGNVLRSIKSVDCFTRLASNSFSTPYPPISPPKRNSKRVQAGLGLDILDTKACNDAGTSSPTYSSGQDLLVPTQEIAQAVTTPDGSAQVLMTHQRTASAAALADVPEEEEEAARTARAGPMIPSLRHAKSFPARIISYEKNEQTQMISPSIYNEDLPSQNNGGLSSELSQSDWEDDIDYCYEHAMEAASFAWGDDDTWNLQGVSDSVQDLSPYFQTSFGTANSGSATSSSVSVPGIITPLDVTTSRDSFATTHSLLFPMPSNIIPSDQSDLPEFQIDCMSIKSKTSTYPPTIITEYSPRNSSSPTSEWSSQESIPTRTTSMAASSQSSKHRYSSSGSSFPDMLPYGVGQATSKTASFHRSKSSENVMPKPLNVAPPQLPTAARLRSNSEAVGKFLDLSMIGAPSSGSTHRSRAGSVASLRPRASYNLFPTTSMVVPSR